MPEQNQQAFLVRRRIHNRKSGNTYSIESMIVYAESVDEAHQKLKQHFESIPYATVTEFIYRDGSKNIEVGTLGVRTDDTHYYSILVPKVIT